MAASSGTEEEDTVHSQSHLNHQHQNGDVEANGQPTAKRNAEMDPMTVTAKERLSHFTW